VWWGSTTILFLAKPVGRSRFCGRVHCHGARTNPHSVTFLDDFVAGSHANFSTHSSKTFDFLFALEKQTPCALSHQHQKENQHCLETGANLPRYFLSGRIKATH
jgi:hypothetical protein